MRLRMRGARNGLLPAFAVTDKLPNIPATMAAKPNLCFIISCSKERGRSPVGVY